MVFALICRRKAGAQRECLAEVPWLLSGGARLEPSSPTPCPVLLLLPLRQGQ